MALTLGRGKGVEGELFLTFPGLKMTLNLGQAEYIQGVSQTAGVVVVVHSHRKMPFPEDEGVFAHPGKLTSIGITKVTESLAEPIISEDLTSLCSME